MRTLIDGSGEAALFVITLRGAYDDQVVAKATLQSGLSLGEIKELHDMALDELDSLGTDGVDLGTAIETVFGMTQRQGYVIHYDNSASWVFERQPDKTIRRSPSILQGINTGAYSMPKYEDYGPPVTPPADIQTSVNAKLERLLQQWTWL